MSVVTRLRDAGFEVYTREQWGSKVLSAYAARAASSSYRLSKPLPYHYLHISVTSDTDTVKEGFAGAQQIETYGYTSPPMVSYQMLVSNEGKVFEGQNYGVKGTHTVNDKKVPGFDTDLNRYGYAVALMQNVQDEVTDEQVAAVAACYAAAELEGWVRKGAPIYPHRMFAWKDCPGDKAVARLNEIMKLKDQFVRAGLRIGKEWDEMATQDEVQAAVERALKTVKFEIIASDGKTVQRNMNWIFRQLEEEQDRTKTLIRQVLAEAKADNYNGPSAAEIATAVKGALPTNVGTSVNLGEIEKAVANVLKKGTGAYTAQ